jgi:UDP-N-acetylmuramoylalanine--D-glutamate ligase
MALSMIKALGLDARPEWLETFQGYPHRQETAGCFQGITYINDSKATSPEAVISALEYFSKSQPLFWIGGGVLQDDDLTDLARLLPRVTKAFFIGEAAPRYGHYMDRHTRPYEISKTLSAALESATQCAAAAGGGTILFSPGCASFDQFRNFEHRGDMFKAWVTDYWGRPNAAAS